MTIKIDEIPCRHGYSYNDYYKGQVFECDAEDELDELGYIFDWDVIDCCDTKCPCYEPIGILWCQKHGMHFEDEPCYGCYFEEWKKIKELFNEQT